MSEGIEYQVSWWIDGLGFVLVLQELVQTSEGHAVEVLRESRLPVAKPVCKSFKILHWIPTLGFKTQLCLDVGDLLFLLDLFGLLLDFRVFFWLFGGNLTVILAWCLFGSFLQNLSSLSRGDRYASLFSCALL